MPSSWKTYTLICLLLIGAYAQAWAQMAKGDPHIHKASMEMTSSHTPLNGNHDTERTGSVVQPLVNPARVHPLHGHYEALSLDRDFTFWNSGRFESRYTGGCLEECRNGQGRYLVENGLLKLQFEGEGNETDPGDEDSSVDSQSSESIPWEPRHFEQMVVQLGGSEQKGQIDYFMVHRPRNESQAMKEVPNDVPSQCGDPEWDCWRRTSEFLPYEELERRSEK